jgi:hypothetical protein
VIAYRAGEAFSFAAHQFQRVADGDVSQGAEVSGTRPRVPAGCWAATALRIRQRPAQLVSWVSGTPVTWAAAATSTCACGWRTWMPRSPRSESDVEIFAEPFVLEPIGQRLAMIKDNSGNVIELAQAGAAVIAAGDYIGWERVIERPSEGLNHG